MLSSVEHEKSFISMGPGLAVTSEWNSKSRQNRGSNNNKVPAKEIHDTYRWVSATLS